MTEKVIILPTQHCFDDALDFIAERVKAEPTHAWRTDLILVHGICLIPNGPRLGERFAHAWVEENDLCWDAGIVNGEQVYYSMFHEAFYLILKVQETTRYTIKEAWIENKKANNYGPWLPEYLELCGRTDAELRKESNVK